MKKKILLAFFCSSILFTCVTYALSLQNRITPKIKTEPVADDADDPAIWVNSKNPNLSLIIGTNKHKRPTGSLNVFDMNGKTLQVIDHIDRPNNVDVEYGFILQGKKVDLVVATERLQHRLLVYKVDADHRRLIDVTGQTTVFKGEKEKRQEPMGIALYKRLQDNAIFAIISRPEGPTTGYLAQYRLKENESGKIDAVEVRRFGRCKEGQEIEAIVVDDELGYVYYSEEKTGIHKYLADPGHPNADRELALFGTTGFKGDREGIGIYTQPNGKGYLFVSDQLEGDTRYHIFPRNNTKKYPQNGALASVWGGADATDGLEITSSPLGSGFPQGVFIVMNSKGKNFFVYDWRNLLRCLNADSN